MSEQIRPAQLPQWLAAHPQAVVLDVREPQEWQTAMVTPKDFMLVTMAMRTVPARLHELNRELPVACLCHHGARSMQVANFLAQSGFTTVANIAGGIHAWADELDPTVAKY